MASTTQIPVQFTKDQLRQLRALATESGRSIAAHVREAVDRALNPAATAGLTAPALWALLRDPAHWLEFKRIAAEMEAQAPLVVAAPVLVPAAPAGPTYRFKRGEGVAPRAAPPEEEKPF